MPRRWLLLLQVLRLRLQSRRGEMCGRATVEALQNQALLRLRQYVYPRSAFYRRFHSGLFNAPLAELPVLSKQMMMEEFDDLVTDPSVRLAQAEAHLTQLQGDELFLSRYRVCATSGSSGSRGIFLLDPCEWAYALSTFDRGARYGGLGLHPFRPLKMAMVTSTAPWHMSARVSASTRNPWVSAISLDAFLPLEDIVRRLNDWNPELLLVYPSIGRSLAVEKVAGRLHLSPKAVLTGSEVLTCETRNRMEAAFGVRVFDQYGATEVGNVAAECDRHNGMHINEDSAIVEVVDQNNRPVPAGDYGEKVLLTTLHRRTQPLIRYELTDMVRIDATPCPCGCPFARITGIQGRSEQILRLPAADGGLIAAHPLLFERVLDQVPAREWQLVYDNGALTVLLSGVREGYDDAVLVRLLHDELSARGVSVPITVRRVPALSRTASGKVAIIRVGKRLV